MSKHSLQHLAILPVRLGLVALGLVTSFGIGFMLGDWLSQYAEMHEGWLKEGIPALGLGILLPFLREVLDVVPILGAYVREGKRDGLWHPCVAFLTIGASIILALNLVETAVEVRSPKLMVWDAWSGGRALAKEAEAVPQATKPAAAPVMFPVFFEKEGAAADDGSFTAGTTLTPAAEQLIVDLVESLVDCVEEGGESSVKLEVLGFASSSPYRGRGPDDATARDFNLKVAHARAAGVLGIIERTVGERRGISVAMREWASTEEMVKERRMNDAVMGEYSPSAGYINRRVEIRLVEAGRCAVTRPGES